MRKPTAGTLTSRFALSAGLLVALAAPGPAAAQAPPALLPGLGTPEGKSGLIVYTQDRRYDTECGCEIGNARNGIFLFNPGNGRRTRIVARREAGSPRFSRDGLTIVYAANQSGNWDLFAIRLNGRGKYQLTRTPEHELRPQFLTGGRIAYTARTRHGTELRTMRPDGSGVRTVAGKGDAEIGAATSSGRKIAFEMCRGRRACDIYVFDRRNQTTRRLTTWGGRDFDPAFSPDGRRIIYMSKRPDPDNRRDSDAQVWVMRSDGSGEHREARPIGASALGNPLFAPDGRRFLVEFAQFIPYGQGDFGSLVIDRIGDGGEPRFIEAEGILFDADWQSIPD